MGYCLITLKAENAIPKVLSGGNSPKFIWILFIFLLNILKAPHWRFTVSKFYSTTQQVACDFREAKVELQYYSHISPKDIAPAQKKFLIIIIQVKVFLCTVGIAKMMYSMSNLNFRAQNTDKIPKQSIHQKVR